MLIRKMSEFRARKKRTQETSGFGERLRSMRVQRSLSQADLAKAVDLHVTHISRYENGVSQPTADNIMKLAEKLKVSGDFLLSGKSSDALTADLDDEALLRLFKQVAQLDDRKKAIVIEFVQAYVNDDKVSQIHPK